MKRILFFISLLAICSCCSVSELKRMSDCSYELVSVSDVKLADVAIDGMSNLKDLTFADLGKVTQTYLNGALPVNFKANVGIKNPNDKTASVEKIDWKIFVEDVEVTSGVIDKKISVDSHRSIVVPIDVSLDLMKLLAGENKKTMLNFAFSLGNASSSKISLKIKPSIKIASKLISSPAYITITEEIGSKK